MPKHPCTCNGWCFTWAVTAVGGTHVVYGLTETYGPYTVCEWHPEWDTLPFAEQARLLARQGQGNVTSDAVRVVDEAMNDVPRDAEMMGEVVMHGNNVGWMGYRGASLCLVQY